MILSASMLVILEFDVTASDQFDAVNIPDTRQFKQWIGQSVGWKLLEFTRTDYGYHIKISRSHGTIPLECED